MTRPPVTPPITPPVTPPVTAPGTLPVALNVNGVEHAVEVEPRRLLADVLRDDLGLTGTTVGCGHGVCGSCTVLLDGVAQRSCLILAVQCGGRAITTVEALAAADGTLHPLQEAFHAAHALQCGFCTPGMVMSCASLLERNPAPKLADVKHAISGNLCRCGAYPKIFAATLDVAQQRRQAAGLVTLHAEREA